MIRVRRISAFILIFAALYIGTILHELGHFLVAKLCGVENVSFAVEYLFFGYTDMSFDSPMSRTRIQFIVLSGYLINYLLAWNAEALFRRYQRTNLIKQSIAAIALGSRFLIVHGWFAALYSNASDFSIHFRLLHLGPAELLGYWAGWGALIAFELFLSKKRIRATFQHLFEPFFGQRRARIG